MSSVAWRIGISRAAPSPPRTHRRAVESASTPFEIPELFKTTRPFPSSRVPDQREPREARRTMSFGELEHNREQRSMIGAGQFKILGHAFTTRAMHGASPQERIRLACVAC